MTSRIGFNLSYCGGGWWHCPIPVVAPTFHARSGPAAVRGLSGYWARFEIQPPCAGIRWLIGA